MNIEEAFNHDWQVGETIWTVVSKYINKTGYFWKGNTGSSYLIPYDIAQITVNKVKRETVGVSSTRNNTYLHVEFDISLPKSEYSYLDVTIAIEKDNVNNKFSYLMSYETDKFFTKEEAEQELIKAKKDLLKKVKRYVKKQQGEIEGHKSQIKFIEENIDNLNNAITNYLQ